MAAQREPHRCFFNISKAIKEYVPALFMALVSLAALGKPTAPVTLLVNGVSNPLAIDRDATRRAPESGHGTMTHEQFIFSRYQ